jgi:hypothetical protein
LGFVDSRCGWAQMSEVADLFYLDFVDYGRGWAQRGIFRNCSPRFLLILNVVGYRRHLQEIILFPRGISWRRIQEKPL